MTWTKSQCRFPHSKVQTSLEILRNNGFVAQEIFVTYFNTFLFSVAILKKVVPINLILGVTTGIWGSCFYCTEGY